jgi:filamentous hemagglutinin family protein
MKTIFRRPGAVSWRILALALLASSLARLAANPVKPVVSQGTAVVSSQGSQMTVQTSASAFINWGSFNIGIGQSTVFLQPSATSVVWNQINDPNPSQILGRLDANGLVVLQNSSGFYVGGQAVINAAGLVMTTAPAPPPDLSSGGMWQFNAPPPTARIVNYGQISAGTGGPVFLIADNIENRGGITAPGGDIGLYAGKQVLVSSRPDGRGLSAEVSLPQGSVDNSGRLIADAGTIALRARVVNQGGLIQANSVREQNGVIELVAGDSLTLGPSSVIEAMGDSQGASPGGQVLLRSGNTFGDGGASTVNVSGGAAGGNGGQVEISAPQMGAIYSQIEGRAAPGWTGGQLSIDPANITLNSTGTSAASGTVNEGDPPSSLTLNVNSFSTFSQILLQASQNITLSSPWNLADNPGASALTLQAGNNITLNSGITAGQNWAVNLVAGADFKTPSRVIPGVGNIVLSGNATVQTLNGNINLNAGHGVSVGSGAIRTVGGGSIAVNAAAGNVNAGSNPNGYVFKTSGYTVSGTLGGISTAAGGNVTITAGGDVTSFLPTATTTSPSDAGSGAFGPESGVVTVTAGGNVYGHFVAADSVLNGAITASSITAQNGNAGAAGNLLALSLVNGGWDVSAPNGSIYLQEVRNPNGVFNGLSVGLAPNRHLFDYSPGSFVDLNAGNAVDLAGSLLPRYTGDAVPVIYPPSLTINAGVGGVTLGNNVILFPSPQGELNIATTGGGSFEGAGYTLAMSDSGATSWTSGGDFSSDHASVPVELKNPNPVVFNISGNLDDTTITTPKETQITVMGNMNNTSFSGQNLHPSDVSFISVAGSIVNQNVYSFVTLAGSGLSLPQPRFPGDAPGYLQVLSDAVVPGSGPNSANGGALLPNSDLFYLPASQQIGYYGKMDQSTGQLLSGSFQVKTYGLNGQPILDANGNYVTQPATLGLTPQVIQSLYAGSQNTINPANAPSGFKIGGPGQFNVTAQSLDLGVAFGIISEGPAGNPALAKLATVGAAININLQGDLDLFSSQISSYYGGPINISSGGAINVGLQDLPLQDSSIPRGIWTSGPSDVNIVAKGDINVSGSRVAAFDGGNVSVTSLQGSVDAGSGGFASVKVNEVIVNPVTGQVRAPQQPVSGSGILATTLPDAPASQKVGNVTVEAPRGNVTASQGGIVQEPLNGNASLTPTLTLIAGSRNTDGSVVFPGNINAGESGVIGVNTTLNAAGTISGLVIARGESSINAAAAVSGTFLAGGSVSFSATTISGIAIGGFGINVSGGKFEGVALSQNVSGGGAQTSLATAATAGSTSQAAAAQQESVQKAETAPRDTSAADDEKKRRAQLPRLAKYSSRVTVILPPAGK